MHIEKHKAAVERRMVSATRNGQVTTIIRAGDLHTEVEGSGKANRMPICCRAMRSLMRFGDRIIAAPPKGGGSSLTIEYRLPR